MDSRNSSRGSVNSQRLLMLLMLLAAFTARMWHLSTPALWLDEAFEYWTAELPWAELPNAVRYALQPPLYTYLLHWWLQVDIAPTWLRFLSVTLSMIGGAALLAWANLALDRVGIWTTGALISITPVVIQYAQDVAEYALLFCTLSCALLCLSRTHTHTGWRRWLALMIWGVLSVYSHYGALLILIPLAGFTFLENLVRQRYQAVYQQALVSLAGLLLIAPLVYGFLWEQFVHMPGRPALSLLLFTAPAASLINLRDTLLTLWMNSGPQVPLPMATQWLGQLGLAIFMLACGYQLVMPGAWAAKRTILWFWLAVAVYYLAVRSGAYAYGVFGGRYSSILAPLFILTGGALGAYLLGQKQNTLALGLTTMYLCLALAAWPQSPFYPTLHGQVRPPEEREDMQSVVHTWRQQRTATEPTYVYEGAIFTFGYYVKLAGLETHTLLSEQNAACRDTAQPGCDDAMIFYGRNLRGHPAVERVAAIWQAMGQQPDRFWLIFAHVYEDEDVAMLTLLREQYTVIATYTGFDAAAYLLQRKL